MKKILELYIPVAHTICETFGEDCEVIIHDLENPRESIVYVVNNHVTGRSIGGSFLRLVPDVLLSDNLQNDRVCNYYFHTEDGRLIKSSTALIRDFDGKVIGAICINLDTSKITRGIGWLQALLPDDTKRGGEEADESLEANDVEHIGEIVRDMIDKIIGSRDVRKLSREERLELIRFMHAKGIFLMKGSVEQVGDRMGLSRPTVYSYIDEVRNGKA